MRVTVAASRYDPSRAATPDPRPQLWGVPAPGGRHAGLAVHSQGGRGRRPRRSAGYDLPMSSDAHLPPDPADPVGLLDEEIEEITEADVETEPISYSGTDFDVEGLVRRINRGDIVVPNFGHGDETLELAGFQRSFVWRKPQMDRFIESLLLGYPIPGIMLYQQADRRYLVLDGQQRLRTLQAYYRGLYNEVVFRLDNVAEEFQGLTYETLDDEQRRTLNNTFIQATIVKTDGTRESRDAVYQVFERLNSGGTQLTPHEIRIALYPGAFVDFIAQLNSIDSWRYLYGPVSPRLRDQELVLRILSLYMRRNEYFSPLKRFLNKFMGDHRELTDVDTEKTREIFEKATQLLEAADARAFLRRAGQRVNSALLEAVVVGVMNVLTSGRTVDPDQLRAAVEEIAADPVMVAASTSSTTTEENVRRRLAAAESGLSSVDA